MCCKRLITTRIVFKLTAHKSKTSIVFHLGEAFIRVFVLTSLLNLDVTKLKNHSNCTLIQQLPLFCLQFTVTQNNVAIHSKLKSCSVKRVTNFSKYACCFQFNKNFSHSHKLLHRLARKDFCVQSVAPLLLHTRLSGRLRGFPPIYSTLFYMITDIGRPFRRGIRKTFQQQTDNEG